MNERFDFWGERIWRQSIFQFDVQRYIFYLNLFEQMDADEGRGERIEMNHGCPPLLGSLVNKDGNIS